MVELGKAGGTCMDRGQLFRRRASPWREEGRRGGRWR